ncbi:hypothetical protein [Pectobacterium brasiliense]|uniref:hypothetical protein n=1 Tax=Pectobacterium brasiliense TaxID=180957 RepID=UPI001968E984|nr:hypothetical protein [Pectobacterium brasiliense]
MNFLIYLDQNTLSELRQRKIEEIGNNELKILKLVMQSKQAVLVYSYVNLEEILQIPKNIYQQEHIDLLIELQAQYIEPLTGRLNNNCPRDIWNDFLEIKKTNNEMGIESLIDFSQLFSRKISGLPVEESFDEINNKLKDSLTSVLENGENQLAAIDMTSLGEEQRAYIINIQNQMNEARELIKTLKAPSFSKEQPLGPQVFRDMPKLKSLEINNLNVG